MANVLIIPCAGEEIRWQRYLGVLKQLVDIEGEVLLQRTLRLFREREPGLTIVVIATDPVFQNVWDLDQGAFVSEPLSDKWMVPKIMSSRSHWSERGRTTIVWGDVWFSKEAVEIICACRGAPLTWFGRSGPSQVTGKLYRELWGLSFYPAAHVLLERACNRPIWRDTTHGESVLPLTDGPAWDAYKAAAGQPVVGPPRPDGTFVEIDDWTEDFDYPSDLDTWCARREAWRKASTPG